MGMTSNELVDSVMLLSPYRSQVSRLRVLIDRLQSKSDVKPLISENIRALTVDSAQGREADLVIVSLVRNNPALPSGEFGRRAAFGFLEAEQRAAVMFSRAKSALVIVGSSSHFAKDEELHIYKAFQYIHALGGVIDAKQLNLLSPEEKKEIRDQPDVA